MKIRRCLLSLLWIGALCLGQNAQYDFYPEFRSWAQQIRRSERVTQAAQIIERYTAKLRSEGVDAGEIERRVGLLKNSRNDLEDDFWNRFFTQGKANYNRAPNDFLIEVVEGRKPGTALDYGMGEGRNALYLAKQGWSVAGFDPAAEAVGVAQRRAKELGVRLETKTVRDSDYDFGHERFDLVLFSWTIADRANIARMIESLKPGGIVVMECGADWVGRNEMLKMYDALQIVRYEVVKAKSDFFNRQEMQVIRMVAMKDAGPKPGGKAEALAPQEESLQERLTAKIEGFEGTVTLYAKNLDSGTTVEIRGAEPVRTASTIKLPILCAVSDAVARGQAKWNEPLTVKKSERSSGTGVIASEISDGVQLPLSDVAHLMMVLSDNTATNMILERFGADAVNAYLDKIGIKTTRSMRKILRSDGGPDDPTVGWSAAGKLPENLKFGLGKSTPRDMVTILEKLERGEIVSAEASKEILAIMRRCQDGNGIRRRMGSVKVANKSGALEALRSDVGIVYADRGRIAMAITVDGIPKANWSPDNPGLLMIADLAKILVDGL